MMISKVNHSFGALQPRFASNLSERQLGLWNLCTQSNPESWVIPTGKEEQKEALRRAFESYVMELTRALILEEQERSSPVVSIRSNSICIRPELQDSWVQNAMRNITLKIATALQPPAIPTDIQRELLVWPYQADHRDLDMIAADVQRDLKYSMGYPTPFNMKNLLELVVRRAVMGTDLPGGTVSLR